MKVLGIVCSPRMHGNTEIIVQEALKSAEEAGAEVEMFTLVGKAMHPCDACESCLKSGKCKTEDDMTPLYQKMLEADGIIFGTPVYFWTVSAQAKIIMDRTYPYRRLKSLRKKVGAALVVTRRAGGTSACSVFNNYFTMQRMVCAGNAICYGADRGDVNEDERGLAEARSVGRVVVRYIKMAADAVIDEDLEKPLKMPPKEFPK